MKTFNMIELMIAHAKSSKKWCMYASWDKNSASEEIIKNAPYLTAELCLPGRLVLEFDSETELDEHFDVTKCDNASHPVYALSCDNEGVILDENT